MMQKIKVGLVGFGKAGNAVAKVLSEDPRFDLCWVTRRSVNGNQQASTELNVPFVSTERQSFVELFDEMPVVMHHANLVSSIHPIRG